MDLSRTTASASCIQPSCLSSVLLLLKVTWKPSFKHVLYRKPQMASKDNGQLFSFKIIMLFTKLITVYFLCRDLFWCVLNDPARNILFMNFQELSLCQSPQGRLSLFLPRIMLFLTPWFLGCLEELQSCVTRKEPEVIAIFKLSERESRSLPVASCLLEGAGSKWQSIC